MDSDCDLLPDWIVFDGWILPAGSRPAHNVKAFLPMSRSHCSAVLELQHEDAQLVC